MASRNKTLIFVRDVNGNMLSGLTLSWSFLYVSSSAGGAYASAVSQFTFAEIGTTGVYEIDDSGISADTHWVGSIDCGATAVPQYRDYELRYEDKQDILYNVNDTFGSTAIGVLTDGTYGLSQIKTQTNTIAADAVLIKGYTFAGSESVIAAVQSVTYGLSAIKSQTGTIATDTGLIKGYTYAGGVSVIAEVQSGVYGLAQIKTQTGTIASDTTLIKGYVYDSGSSTSTIGLLRDGTNGLAAIQTQATNARKVASNRWKVSANQLVVYDDNGTSALYTFNLFDSTGTPTSTDITERQRV